MKESMDKALKFSHLESKLIGLRRPLSSLYFLYQLAGGQQFTFIPGRPFQPDPSNVSILAASTSSSSSFQPLPLFSQGVSLQQQSLRQPPIDGNRSMSVLLPNQLSQMSLTLPAGSAIPASNDSAYHSYQQHNQSAAMKPQEQAIKSRSPDLLKTVGRAGTFISDSAILNDLLFVFQGADGEFIKWNSHKQAFVIDQKV